MNTQVYYHRVRRIYDLYLSQYFEAQGQESFDSAEKILAQNDLTTMSGILSAAEDSGARGHEWAVRIRDRRHHRIIHETSERAKAADVGCSRTVCNDLKERYPSLAFQWDHTSLIKIHKLFLPDEDDELSKRIVQLQVVGRDGSTRHLADESVILSKVPRVFQVARIFCDISSTGSQRTEITEVARRQFFAARAQGGPS
mgnify:CR=1 FL=1